MSIIITGASGKFGHLVTNLLCQQVRPTELILVTRNPKSLA